MRLSEIPLIEFRGVTKEYNGLPVLDSFNLHVAHGEFIFVVGSSGAGKSTFLKLITREERPTRGQILMNGVPLDALSAKDLPYLRRKIGCVYQDFRLLENLSVYKNVELPLQVTGVPHKLIPGKVRDALALTGLADKSDAIPSDLSGGEQQRAALARALANEPKLILADEPTGNVDPERSVEIISLLDKINSHRGTTVIMVTHEHMMVRRFRRRTIALENGHVVDDRVPEFSKKLLLKELEAYEQKQVSKDWIK